MRTIDPRPFALVIALVGCASTEDNVLTSIDAAVGDAATPDAALDAALDAASTCATPCGPNASCDGTTCVCDEGFQGDGISCHQYWALIASYPVVIHGGTTGTGWMPA